MEAEPAGPWLTPEAVAAGAGRLAGERPLWWTGTVEDQFTPIYLTLARPTASRMGFAPGDVDEMDLTTIWAFLGGNQQIIERRAAVEAARAVPDGVQMVPLTDEEKAARLAGRRAVEARRGRRRDRQRGTP